MMAGLVHSTFGSMKFVWSCRLPSSKEMAVCRLEILGVRDRMVCSGVHPAPAWGGTHRAQEAAKYSPLSATATALVVAMSRFCGNLASIPSYLIVLFLFFLFLVSFLSLLLPSLPCRWSHWPCLVSETNATICFLGPGTIFGVSWLFHLCLLIQKSGVQTPSHKA